MEQEYQIAESFHPDFSLLHATHMMDALHEFITTATLHARESIKERRVNQAHASLFLASNMMTLITDIQRRIAWEVKVHDGHDILATRYQQKWKLAEAQNEAMMKMIKRLDTPGFRKEKDSALAYWYADQLMPVLMLPAARLIRDALAKCSSTDQDEQDALSAVIHSIKGIMEQQQYSNDPEQVKPGDEAECYAGKRRLARQEIQEMIEAVRAKYADDTN